MDDDPRCWPGESQDPKGFLGVLKERLGGNHDLNLGSLSGDEER